MLGGFRKCEGGNIPPEIVRRRVQVVRPLHLQGVVSDSLWEAEGEFMVGEVPPGGGAVAERFEDTN